MRTIEILLLTACAVFHILAAPAQRDGRAEAQLQAAINKETVEGDLKSAIEMYGKVAQSSNRTAAAKALVRMGQCYEKLGDVEARKAYERAVRDFADQKDAAATARARLSALAQPVTKNGLTVRQVWTDLRSGLAGSNSTAQFNTLGAPSLDGRYITTTDRDTGDLSIIDLTTKQLRHITKNKSTADGNAEYSVPSPDGKRIAYGWCDKGCYLKVINIDGTGERVLFKDPGSRYTKVYDWSPDGKYILGAIQNQNHTESRMALIAVADGSVRTLKTLGPPPDADNMSFSPDSRFIVYDAVQDPQSGDRDIYLIAADGSRETPLVQHPANEHVLGWAPDGRRVIFASNRLGTMGAWSIQVIDGKPQGPPELIRKDFGGGMPLGRAMTRQGALFYHVNTAMVDVYTAELDPDTGKLLAAPKPVATRFPGANSLPFWSPDGTLLAYQSQRAGAGADPVVAVFSAETGKERIIAPQLPKLTLTGWTRDSQSLFGMALNASGQRVSHRIDVRTGETTPGQEALIRSADGKWGFRWDWKNKNIYARNLETREEKVIYHNDDADCCLDGIAPSPDGTQLAALLDDKVIVVPVSGGAARELVKLREKERFVAPRYVLGWTEGGRYILFGKQKTPANELWRVPADGGEAQKLELAMPGLVDLRVHPDGRRIAFTAGERKPEIWVMENFLAGGGK